MSTLNEDIKSLSECGINPHDLIHISRSLGHPALIDVAFPSMPAHMRYELYCGERFLFQDLDEPDVWFRTAPRAEYLGLSA